MRRCEAVTEPISIASCAKEEVSAQELNKSFFGGGSHCAYSCLAAIFYSHLPLAPGH